MTDSCRTPDVFTLFSSFNRSKFEGKENEYWAKAEWPVEQIRALANWAIQDAEKVTNQKGEECVVVAQKKDGTRTSQAGNEYFLGVTSDVKATQAQPAAADLPF